MLNVHRLAVLHAVASSGSVTAAAAELNYTPSAVSQHIAALERETQAPLLERHGRRVRPTAAGALLARYAGEILERVAEAEAALAALNAGRTGRIRLASLPSAATGLVPAAVAEFRAQHPDAEVDLALAEQLDALAAVRLDRVDLAVAILDLATGDAAADPAPDDHGLRWEPLLEDPYFVVLPAEHPLSSAPEIELSQLADQRLVSGDRNRSCPCAQEFLAVCGRAGFRPRFTIEVDDYPTVQSLVAAGLGVAAVPLLGLSPAVHEGLIVRPLVRPTMRRRIFAVTRASRPREPLFDAMLSSLRAAAGALAIPGLTLGPGPSDAALAA